MACLPETFLLLAETFTHSLIYRPVDFPWPDTPWPWAVCVWMGISYSPAWLNAVPSPSPQNSLHFSLHRVWGRYSGIKHGPWPSDTCLRETPEVLPQSKGPGQGKGKGRGRAGVCTCKSYLQFY